MNMFRNKRSTFTVLQSPDIYLMYHYVFPIPFMTIMNASRKRPR